MIRNYCSAIAGAALTGALIGTGPAHASLTAEDLLDHWVKAAEMDGLEFEWSSLKRTDNGLELYGVVERMSADGSDYRLAMESLTLTENLNGTVDVAYPDRVSLEISVRGLLRDDSRVLCLIAGDGIEMVARRDVQMQFDLSAASLAVSCDLRFARLLDGLGIGRLTIESEGLQANWREPFGGRIGLGELEAGIRFDRNSFELNFSGSDFAYSGTASGLEFEALAIPIVAGKSSASGLHNTAFSAASGPLLFSLKGADRRVHRQPSAEIGAEAWEFQFVAGSNSTDLATSAADFRVSVRSAEDDSFSAALGSVSLAAKEYSIGGRDNLGLAWLINDIRIGPDTMNFIDPGQFIRNPPGKFSGKVSMALPEFEQDETGAESPARAPARVPLSIDISSLQAELFGATLEASGEMLNDPIEAASGAFSVVLSGFAELSEAINQAKPFNGSFGNLVNLTLLLGRETPDGKLRFDIEYREPDQLILNGVEFN